MNSHQHKMEVTSIHMHKYEGGGYTCTFMNINAPNIDISQVKSLVYHV